MKRLRHSVVHDENCDFHWGEDCSCWDTPAFRLQPEHIVVIVYVAVLVGLLIAKVN